MSDLKAGATAYIIDGNGYTWATGTVEDARRFLETEALPNDDNTDYPILVATLTVPQDSTWEEACEWFHADHPSVRVWQRIPTSMVTSKRFHAADVASRAWVEGVLFPTTYGSPS